jgi:hypothetical protein
MVATETLHETATFGVNDGGYLGAFKVVRSRHLGQGSYADMNGLWRIAYSSASKSPSSQCTADQ